MTADPTSDQTIRPNHQIISPSDQATTSKPDQQNPPDYYPWLLSFKSAQHTQSSEIVQVRCILCGLGQGGYIELWMNLAKHTFHTRSAWSFRNFFRLNLTVVRLASGFPGLVRASPSLFHKMGSFAGVRSAVSSAFRNRFGFLDSASSFCAFSRWTSAAFVVVVVVVVFTSGSRLVAPNLNWTITLHLTVYALLKWSFHPQGSTRLWLF